MMFEIPRSLPGRFITFPEIQEGTPARRQKGHSLELTSHTVFLEKLGSVIILTIPNLFFFPTRLLRIVLSFFALQVLQSALNQAQGCALRLEKYKYMVCVQCIYPPLLGSCDQLGFKLTDPRFAHCGAEVGDYWLLDVLTSPL